MSTFKQLLVLLAACGAVVVVAGMYRDSDAAETDSGAVPRELVAPAPTVRLASAGDSAPALPPSKRAQFPALVATLVLRAGDRDGPELERRTVARSSDRVHLGLHDGAEEWLFRRNPLDAARFSAVRALHAKRQLVEYDQVALQMEGLASSWDEIASLGFDPLDATAPDGAQRRAFGAVFVHLVRPQGAPAGRVREAWWCEELALPLELTLEDHGRTIVQEVAALELRESREDLTDLDQRYPGHASQDVADWREHLHEHE